MDMSRCWLRLQSNAEYTRLPAASMAKRRRVPRGLGQAISYRFKRDGRGWRVFVTTRMMDVPVVTDQRERACNRRRFERRSLWRSRRPMPAGNCLNAWRVPLVTYRKSTHQTEALIGDAVAWGGRVRP